MNNVSFNLSMVFDKIWDVLHFVFYWDSIPFTLWDVLMSGLIVKVMYMFLREIVFFWRHDNDFDFD